MTAVTKHWNNKCHPKILNHSSAQMHHFFSIETLILESSKIKSLIPGVINDRSVLHLPYVNGYSVSNVQNGMHTVCPPPLKLESITFSYHSENQSLITLYRDSLLPKGSTKNPSLILHSAELISFTCRM